MLERNKKLEAAILDDLNDPSLTHLVIAVRHHVGLGLVVKTAKKHGIIRKRGRKPTVIQIKDELQRKKQADRLAKGWCPTHGLPLTQVGTYNRRDGEPQGHTVSVCPRKDCRDAKYWQTQYGSPATPLKPAELTRFTDGHQ